MPKLENDDLEQHAIPTSRYGFSATRIDNLGATEYTLVTICVDESSSVTGFKPDLQKGVKEVINSCKLSPRADNLMIRIITFSSDHREFHGFKLLQETALDDYDDCVNPGGMTALYDSIENAISSTSGYGKSLLDNDFLANGLIVVITDGMDNMSKSTPNTIKQLLEDVPKTEVLESLTTILIGINTLSGGVSQYLKDVKEECVIDQYIDITDASPKSIAKMANFISQSISSSSQALGTGGPSQALVF